LNQDYEHANEHKHTKQEEGTCNNLQNQKDEPNVEELGQEMVAFWFVAPCSLVEVYLRFRDAYCLHHQGNRPETFVSFY
jgi:hypothetical protein